MFKKKIPIFQFGEIFQISNPNNYNIIFILLTLLFFHFVLHRNDSA